MALTVAGQIGSFVRERVGRRRRRWTPLAVARQQKQRRGYLKQRRSPPPPHGHERFFFFFFGRYPRKNRRFVSVVIVKIRSFRARKPFRSRRNAARTTAGTNDREHVARVNDWLASPSADQRVLPSAGRVVGRDGRGPPSIPPGE